MSQSSASTVYVLGSTGSQVTGHWPQTLWNVNGVSWMDRNSEPYWIAKNGITWTEYRGQQYMMYKKKREPQAKYVKFRANESMDPVYVTKDSYAHRFIEAADTYMRIVKPDRDRGLDYYTILPQWQVRYTDWTHARDRSRSRERARQAAAAAT